MHCWYCGMYVNSDIYISYCHLVQCKNYIHDRHLHPYFHSLLAWSHVARKTFRLSHTSGAINSSLRHTKWRIVFIQVTRALQNSATCLISYVIIVLVVVHCYVLIFIICVFLYIACVSTAEEGSSCHEVCVTCLDLTKRFAFYCDILFKS